MTEALSSPANGNSKAFDTYYQEFASLLQQLESSPSEHNNNNQNNNNNNKDTSALYQQCSDLIRLMTLEARSTDEGDTDMKLERAERVKIYKFQLEAVRNQHDAQFLMGSAAADMLELEKQQQRLHVKQRLERTEMRAAQQNELLERARRSVEETETIGAEILSQVQRNRESIQSAHARVHALSGMTDRAGNIIKNMSRPWWLRR